MVSVVIDIPPGQWCTPPVSTTHGARYSTVSDWGARDWVESDLTLDEGWWGSE